MSEQERDPRIKTVILWQNGMVMVFGQDGQQLPEYQGPVEEVRDKIKRAYAGQWEYKVWDVRWGAQGQEGNE